MRYLIFFLFFFVLPLAQAQGYYEVGAFDVNNQQPIEDALFQVDNSTSVLDSNSTDATGYARVFHTQNDANITYTLSALSYHTQTITQDRAVINSSLMYLVPVSDDGIVRFRISDLTGFGLPGIFASEREFRVYDDERGRLHGVYHLNDTIQLPINKQYSVRPTVSSWDWFASIGNLRRYLPTFITYALGLSVLFAFVILICAMAVGLLWKLRRR